MAIKIKDAEGNEHEVLTAAEQTDMVTGAVNKSAKKLQAELSATLTASIGETLAKTLTEYDAKRQEEAAALEAEREAAAQTKGKGKNGEAAPAAQDVENSAAFRTLQKKLDAALKAQADEATARKAEAAKAKDIALRQRIAEEMDKAGFDSKARHLALSHLVDGAKLVRYSEDGESIVFKDTDGDVELAAGLKSFAQTEDGKRFMPASGASGTGDRSRFTPPKPSSDGKVQPGSLARMVLAAADGFNPSGLG